MVAIKVMSVFGTRPDAIKMAPLVKELEKYPQIKSLVCVTAQHRQMLDQVLNIFNIKTDYDLDIMQERQTLEQITVKALQGLSDVFRKELPDIVLVHGDTTTCFVASLAAFYNKISIGHVEAGLRTFDKYFPYPEEMNRKLTGAMADLHFAPTNSNKKNLLNEGVKSENIYVTGNTVIDALKTTVKENYIFENQQLKNIQMNGQKIISVTAHRRENLGKPLENICFALKEIAQEHPSCTIIYSVHLNPAVQETAHSILDGCERVHLIDPLSAQDMHNLIARSYLVLTDSGGLQEEAPSLGKPVLVLRNETERPEAVEAGTVRLAGTNFDRIVSMASELIENDDEYQKMAKAVNPYGDGFASKRICEAILHHFKIIDKRPEDFSY